MYDEYSCFCCTSMNCRLIPTTGSMVKIMLALDKEHEMLSAPLLISLMCTIS